MKAIFISYLKERHHRDFLEWPAIGWPILLKYFPNRSSVVRSLLINTLWSDSWSHGTGFRSFQFSDDVAGVVIPLLHLPTLSPPPPEHTTPSPCSHVTTDVTVMSACWPHPPLVALEFLGCSSRILQLSNVKKFLQLAALNFLGCCYWWRAFLTCFIAVTVDNLPVVGRSVGYGSGGLILSLSSLYFFDAVCYTTKTRAKWSNASRLC